MTSKRKEIEHRLLQRGYVCTIGGSEDTGYYCRSVQSLSGKSAEPFYVQEEIESILDEMANEKLLDSIKTPRLNGDR